MYFDDIYNMIFDLNECLCNININIDPYVLIEIVLLKYINSGNNSKFVLGNNSVSNSNNVKDNKISVIKSNKTTKKEDNSVLENNLGNNTNAESIGVELSIGSTKNNSTKKQVIHKKKTK